MLEALNALVERGNKVTFVRTRGHAGIRLSEEADKLADEGATKTPPGTPAKAAQAVGKLKQALKRAAQEQRDKVVGKVAGGAAEVFRSAREKNKKAHKSQEPRASGRLWARAVTGAMPKIAQQDGRRRFCWEPINGFRGEVQHLFGCHAAAEAARRWGLEGLAAGEALAKKDQATAFLVELFQGAGQKEEHLAGDYLSGSEGEDSQSGDGSGSEYEKQDEKN